MASGNSLLVFTPYAAEFPASGFAVPSTRNEHPILLFGDAADQTVYWSAVLPRHYAGGGITARIAWMAAATAGGSLTVEWEGAFERHTDDAEDLDSTGLFATAKAVTDTPASATGELSYIDLAFSNTEIDGLLVGEHFRFRLVRDVSDDTLTDTAQLVSIELRET